MGMRHIDSNTRQCMATSHVAYKQSFGFDARLSPTRILRRATRSSHRRESLHCSHPIMWQRAMMNRRAPRSSSSTRAAPKPPWPRPFTWPCGEERPHPALRARASPDRARRREAGIHRGPHSGYAEFARFVAGFIPGRVAAETGVPEATLHRLAAIITSASASRSGGRWA